MPKSSAFADSAHTKKQIIQQHQPPRLLMAGLTFTPDGVHELPLIHMLRQDIGHLVVAMGTHRLIQLQGLGVETGRVQNMNL